MLGISSTLEPSTYGLGPRALTGQAYPVGVLEPMAYRLGLGTTTGLSCCQVRIQCCVLSCGAIEIPPDTTGPVLGSPMLGIVTRIP